LFLSQWSRGFLEKTLFFILSGLKPLSFPLTARFYETMFSKWYPLQRGETRKIQFPPLYKGRVREG
jgi:hypothetical protein